MNLPITKTEPNHYDPAKLLDTLIEKMAVDSDAELAMKLGLQCHIIGALRNRRIPIEGSILLRMHEVTRLSIRQLRDLLGDRRNVFRSNGWD